MKLFVQWATRKARGWTEIDSSEWLVLAKKPLPVGGEKIDNKPGWLNDVCVQGMCSGTADHVAIEEIGDAICLTLWNDDPEDYKPGEYFARVLTFHPLRPDPELGGAVNTHIESVIYAGWERYEELEARNLADT